MTLKVMSKILWTTYYKKKRKHDPKCYMILRVMFTFLFIFIISM